MSTQTAIHAPASYDINAGVTADVEPAVAAQAGLRLVGVSMRESAGSPAVATGRIVHGAMVSGGDLVLPIELAANESKVHWFGPDGVAMSNGISIDHVAGTFDCTVFYKVVN